MLLLNEVDDANAARTINATVMHMVEAELLQQEFLANSDATASVPAVLTPEAYLRIIDGKTASLFATACALGNPDYRDYGLCYGRLFQMYDDIRDGEQPPFVNALMQTEEARLDGLAPLPSMPHPREIVQ